MGSKIVGESDCSIAAICNILEQVSIFEPDFEKWNLLANNLVSLPTAGVTSNAIKYEDVSIYDAFTKILETWITLKKNRATLKDFIEALEVCQLFRTADEIRKGFRCKPKPIDEKIKQLNGIPFDLLEREIKTHIFDNVEGLAQVTMVTSSLLRILRTTGIIDSEDQKLLEMETEESKPFSFYRILITKQNFDLKALINALEHDNQYDPSWDLREFYDWVENNQEYLLNKIQKESVSVKEKTTNDQFSEIKQPPNYRFDNTCSENLMAYSTNDTLVATTATERDILILDGFKHPSTFAQQKSDVREKPKTGNETLRKEDHVTGNGRKKREKRKAWKVKQSREYTGPTKKARNSVSATHTPFSS